MQMMGLTYFFWKASAKKTKQTLAEDRKTDREAELPQVQASAVDVEVEVEALSPKVCDCSFCPV